MKKICSILILSMVVLWQSCANKTGFNVKNYGAVGDGATINTQAIQKAVDECHSKGGGTVIIPEGVYISGTLYMKDNVNLHLEERAILKGSASFSDYPDNKVKYINSFTHPPGKEFGCKALIFAEGVRNVSVTGKGTIDGNGDNPAFQLGNDSSPESRKRPCMLLFIDSKNIKVHGLHLRNSAYWLQNYLGCDTLHLKGLNIYNHTNFNQDAMDIDANNVLVEDCNIDADDDGICLKSHDPNRIVENVTVRNCTIATNCNAVKFGTKSDGGFRNINISNCFIKKASEDNMRKWQENLKFIELPTTVISGIALESVDGGMIDNVTVSDITMQDVQTPIFVIMGRRNAGQAGNQDFYNSEKNGLEPSLKVGRVSNLTLRNITAISHSKMTSSISAVQGYYVENVTLENIKISTMGDGTKAEADAPLPEYAGSYPENRMYGFVYPSSGLFLRHIKNVTLKNIDLSVRKEDFRPSVILDDVHKISIDNLMAAPPAGNQPIFKIINSTAIDLSNTKTGTNPLAVLAGTDKKEVTGNHDR